MCSRIRISCRIFQDIKVGTVVSVSEIELKAATRGGSAPSPSLDDMFILSQVNFVIATPLFY